MYFNDHNPPHFHVEYQGYTAIVNIEDGTIRGEMPRKQLGLIYEWIDENREDLLKNWKLSVEQKPLFKVKPLTK